MNVTQVAWTDAEKAVVKEGRKKGVSASRIAAKLPGRTRNAVVALAHREGYDTPMPTRNPAGRKAQANRPLSVSPAASRPLPPPLPPPPPLVASQMRSVPLEDLLASECRFPVGGTGPRHLFCGAPAEKDSAWCAHHRERVYRRERDAAA